MVRGRHDVAVSERPLPAGPVGAASELQEFDLGGTLPGPRTVEITRRYVRAFLDLQLRAKPQALLNGPSTRYPEVAFCTPETTTCT